MNLSRLLRACLGPRRGCRGRSGSHACPAGPIAPDARLNPRGDGYYTSAASISLIAASRPFSFAIFANCSLLFPVNVFRSGR